MKVNYNSMKVYTLRSLHLFIYSLHSVNVVFK
jgi:hypothetical protein